MKKELKTIGGETLGGIRSVRASTWLLVAIVIFQLVIIGQLEELLCAHKNMHRSKNMTEKHQGMHEIRISPAGVIQHTQN